MNGVDRISGGAPWELAIQVVEPYGAPPARAVASAGLDVADRADRKADLCAYLFLREAGVLKRPNNHRPFLVHGISLRLVVIKYKGYP